MWQTRPAAPPAAKIGTSATELTEASVRHILSRTTGDVAAKIEALKYLITTMPTAERVTRILPDVVQCLLSPQLTLKRLTMQYLLLCCQRGVAAEKEVLLLSVNSLQRQCSAREHIVRGWAIKTLSSLADVPEAQAALESVLQRGVSDGSSFVRAAVANAAYKVAAHDSSRVAFVWDSILVRLLVDVEPVVQAAAAVALQQLLIFYPEILELVLVPARLESLGFTPTEEEPLLSRLHKIVPRFTAAIIKMPWYGQQAAIELLRLYWRTFSCRVSRSNHRQLACRKVLDVLRYSQSVSVVLNAARFLYELRETADGPAPDTVLVENLIHRLRLTGSTSVLGTELLVLLYDLFKEAPVPLSPYTPDFILHSLDSSATRYVKLQLLQVAAGAEPSTAICDHLMVALRWNHGDQVPWNNRRVGAADILNLVCRLNGATPTVVRDLVELMAASESPSLVRAAVQELERAAVPTDFLPVALRLAETLLIGHPGDGGPAMLSLISRCAPPAVANDVFRLLVKREVMENNLEDSLLLELLDLGCDLCYREQENSHEGQQGQRLNQMLDILINYECNKEVEDPYSLSRQLALLLRDLRGENFAESANSANSANSKIKLPLRPRDAVLDMGTASRVIKLDGGISSQTFGPPLRGFREKAIPFADEEFVRPEIPDKEREAILIPATSEVAKPISQAFEEEASVNAFYGQECQVVFGEAETSDDEEEEGEEDSGGSGQEGKDNDEGSSSSESD